ncbi:MAG TPA: cell division protein FtsZ, partial [Candidatus Hydrogenedentes bacterium]|nr:cell division protein FtsZ [Candidatus Hydrogenedentota bacterium]
MADEFTTFEQRAKIKVCGIGGGGGNAVTRMIEQGLGGVDFIAINTDAQDLRRSKAGVRLQIGSEVTGGLGSGAKPEVGRKAAEEDRERIAEVVSNADMVFLTAGLGGGTGTGAGPVVAEVASSTGALTVGIVTLPFSFEGEERAKNAAIGLNGFEKSVDALIVVPNDQLAELTMDKSFLSAFEQADEVLHNGVRAISEIISMPGLVNVDFGDVETIMRDGGRSLMGIAVAQGEERARKAATQAMVCPLLQQSTIRGAKGVIVNILG